MDWHEEPATEHQLFQLHEFGFTPTCALTVTQAARLIRQYSKAGRSAAPPSAPAPVSTPVPRGFAGASPAPAPQPSAGPVSAGARAHAYQLQVAVEAAELMMKQHPDQPNVKADHRSTVAARQQFWLDTCRDPRDMHFSSAPALEFYQRHGAHFFPPTWEEVREVLDALDRGMPGWDKDRPELFYETLRLNFPSLLRQK